MANLSLLVVVGGKRTQQQSNTASVDYLAIAIGATPMPVIQSGTGAGAYFDFGARSLQTSFAPASANDLTNKNYVDNKVASITITSWQQAVISQTNTPPSSPATGDRYLIGTAPTGVWVANANYITQWNGSTWIYIAPQAGMIVDSIAITTGVYLYAASMWTLKNFAAYSASTGIRLVGTDIQRDDALSFTNANASAITLGQVVYIKSTGSVDLASAFGSAAGTNQLGIVDDPSIAAGGTGRIDIRPGYIMAATGLTPGMEYYLSNSTPGAIALYASLTYALGDSVIRVGKALSATQFLFNPSFEYQF
jgi:3D (Asp-Asp-Asp) domain-containing protein